MSRTVVRETLRQLEAEGLVRLEANRGAIVPEISYADAEALYELREALESTAAALFARRGNEEQKAELVRALKRALEALADSSTDEILAAKDVFYDALLSGAGNHELTAILRRLHARIRTLRRYSLSRAGRASATAAEITAVCHAVTAGDIEGARLAAALHVRQARYTTLPALLDISADLLDNLGDSTNGRAAPVRRLHPIAQEADSS